MAYKSLYRKYRPSNFENVSGQNFIIKTLMNAIENEKISHAYLFTGTRGTGKTTIAKIFAKMVNCLQMTNNKPCGKCKICLNENTDEIADIIEIDAASNNGVDEIRELKNKIKLVPVECKYKVYIIDEVHMLSTGAFNALLKTLEEPPSHVIFILATTEPQKLPITIISRCQRFDFEKISSDDIYNRLKYISECENIDIEDSALVEISKMCDGAMRDAISTLDQLSSYSSKKITLDDIYVLKGIISQKDLLNLCKNYLDEDLEEILDIIENLYQTGKNFNLILDNMLNLFRNMLIYKKAPNYFKNKDISLKSELIELSNKVDYNLLQEIILKFDKISKDMQSSNYPRILFELCLLSSYKNESKITLKEEEKQVSVESKVITKVIEKSDKTTLLADILKPKVELESASNIVINDITDDNSNSFYPPKQTKNKKILINNTIALASTKCKKIIKDSFMELDRYLINEKFKTAATILKDATVVAASEDHLLITYKYDSMVDDNDNEITSIRNLLFDLLSKDYKIVAITDSEWKEERPFYVNLKKSNGKIDLIDETTESENEVNDNINNVNDIFNIFGNDLVEMEG